MQSTNTPDPGEFFLSRPIHVTSHRLSIVALRSIRIAIPLSCDWPAGGLVARSLSTFEPAKLRKGYGCLQSCHFR